MRTIPPSGIRRFFDMLAEMKDVISLTIGEPDFTTPEPITPAAIAQPGGGGDPLHRQRRDDRAARADRRQPRATATASTYDPRTELVITVGASEGVDASLRATINAGDEVIYHEPCFVAYAPCIQLAGGEAVAGQHDRRDRLPGHRRDDRAPRSRRARRRSSSAIRTIPPAPCWTGPSSRRSPRSPSEHDLLVYSDEIYDRLVYGDHEHTAFSALPGMRERTVLLGGFSKSYAMTGWRIG